MPGVPEAINALHAAGYRILIVTNQRGVARGLLTSAKLDAVHRYMCAEIEAHGGRIDGIYVCPHEEGTCDCRKPQIGLFLQAEQDFAIDKPNSWMIGDSDSDIEAGRRYGVRTIRTSSLPEAAKMILEDRI